jgi:hypothetical protein
MRMDVMDVMDPLPSSVLLSGEYHFSQDTLVSCCVLWEFGVVVVKILRAQRVARASGVLREYSIDNTVFKAALVLQKLVAGQLALSRAKGLSCGIRSRDEQEVTLTSDSDYLPLLACIAPAETPINQ